MNDGLGACRIWQNEEIRDRLKQHLRKRLGDRGSHLCTRCGVERLGKATLPRFVIGPLRITVPKAITPAMKARTERTRVIAKRLGDTRPSLGERSLRTRVKPPPVQHHEPRTAIAHKAPNESGNRRAAVTLAKKKI